MKIFYTLFRRRSVYFTSSKSYSNPSLNFLRTSANNSPFSINKSMHCYQTIHPWQNFDEFSEYLISCIEYNEDGLLVLNKPFGVKIHGHDKPGARPKSELQFIRPSVPECDYTVEDALPQLQRHFNLPELSIVKSAEKYTSGVVLLSSSKKVTEKIKKSFEFAKLQKKSHLVHWAITIGYPVVPFRKERVGVKFVETGKMKQPVIVSEISKRACKRNVVSPVRVESRSISVNEKLSTSLVEIACNKVKYHFVRVYASSQIAPILGDIMYGSRMKTFLGVPVKVQLQDIADTGFAPMPAKMCEALDIPKGTAGQLMVPTMIHLRTVVLPNYYQKDRDFSVTASLPPHFQWTANRLNLLCDK